MPGPQPPGVASRPGFGHPSGVYVALPRRAGRCGTAALLLATPLALALPVAAFLDAVAPIWRGGALPRSSLVWFTFALAWISFALLTSFALHGPRRDLRVRVWASTVIATPTLALLVTTALGVVGQTDSDAFRYGSQPGPLRLLALACGAPLLLLAAPVLIWVVGRAASVYETGAIPELVALLRTLTGLLLATAVGSVLASPALAPPVAIALALALLASSGARELERRRLAVLAAVRSGELRRVPRALACLDGAPPRLGQTPSYALVAESATAYRDRPVALYLAD